MPFFFARTPDKYFGCAWNQNFPLGISCFSTGVLEQQNSDLCIWKFYLARTFEFSQQRNSCDWRNKGTFSFDNLILLLRLIPLRFEFVRIWNVDFYLWESDEKWFSRRNQFHLRNGFPREIGFLLPKKNRRENGFRL